MRRDAFAWEEHLVPLRAQQQTAQEALLVLVEECVAELNRRNGTRLRSSALLHAQKHRVIAEVQRQQHLTRSQFFADVFALKRLLFALLEQREVGFYERVQDALQSAHEDSILIVPDPAVERAVRDLLESAKGRVFRVERTEEAHAYAMPTGAANETTTLTMKYKLVLQLRGNAKLQRICELVEHFAKKLDGTQQLRVWIWTKSHYYIDHVYKELQTHTNTHTYIDPAVPEQPLPATGPRRHHTAAARSETLPAQAPEEPQGGLRAAVA